MEKIDLSKELKPLYSPRAGKFVIVDVPKLSFLMVDGEGDPNNALSYEHAIEVLYSVAYNAKFQLKLGPEKTDFRVMPLETLWWADDMADFIEGHKDRWKWTAMMAVPNVVTPKVVAEASAAAGQKKELPALKLLRLTSFHEGNAVQTLFVGPYAD